MTTTLTVDAKALERALAAVWHAVGDKWSRPMLASVLFNGTDKGLTLVASDNVRIALMRVTDDAAAAGAIGRSPIHRDDVAALRSVLKRSRGDVQLSVHDGALDVEVPWGKTMIRLQLPLIDGTWPAYEDFLDRWLADLRPMVALTPRFFVNALNAARKAGSMEAELEATRVYAGKTTLDAAVIRVGEHDEYTEFVMPARIHGPNAEFHDDTKEPDLQLVDDGDTDNAS